ncbi:hypothetical protein FOA52_003765 [Chlamydomonas sp. UWO 241]|nr:hypothetical protein FOA52_003765 [Chlamydomonas sp. UWO 241]
MAAETVQEVQPTPDGGDRASDLPSTLHVMMKGPHSEQDHACQNTVPMVVSLSKMLRLGNPVGAGMGCARVPAGIVHSISRPGGVQPPGLAPLAAGIVHSISRPNGVQSRFVDAAEEVATWAAHENYCGELVFISGEATAYYSCKGHDEGTEHATAVPELCCNQS